MPKKDKEEKENQDHLDNNGNKIKAIELAKKQREISIAEFFEKNRHLLGFDNKRKALLTTVKEAVDNSLDACEEADILPEISVEIIDMGNDRFRLIIEDNGPGIVKEQIPKIFAKLLYGSKFHRLKQARGQQGIGISAAVLYSQLTTGRPAKILSKISPDRPAHYYELKIDTQKNAPEILADEKKEWAKDKGTKIEMDLEGTYIKGGQSVDEYLKETAIVNPHVTIIYTNPKAEQIIFPRATDEKPKESKEIKPHPYGVELGILMKMLKWSESRTLQSFLTNEFSRVSPDTAKQICENAATLPNMKPQEISRETAEKIMEGIKKTKIMNPPTDCISPIGAELLERGLKKEVNAEFFCSTTRPPSVYRGNPFIIEAAIAYGGSLNAEGSVNILRFANRVPLLYQPGACAITDSIEKTSWRAYGLQQSGSNLPQGPCIILIHMASVWVPFTSEAKEAIAHYPEIIKEIKLALQECGRKLSVYVNKKRRVQDEFKKKSYIEKYLPHVGIALKELLELKQADEEKIISILKEILEKTRPEAEIENGNQEYDEEDKVGLEFDKDEEDEDTEDGKEDEE
jgi:DNA topoisomerase-6 subunit B